MLYLIRNNVKQTNLIDASAHHLCWMKHGHRTRGNLLGNRFDRTILWQRVRHQVALLPGHGAALTIASEVTLSQPFLLDWALWMRRSLPDIALRATSTCRTISVRPCDPVHRHTRRPADRSRPTGGRSVHRPRAARCVSVHWVCSRYAQRPSTSAGVLNRACGVSIIVSDQFAQRTRIRNLIRSQKRRPCSISFQTRPQHSFKS